MQRDGQRLNMAEVYRRFVQTSGVDNPEGLFEDIEEEPMPEEMMPKEQMLSEEQLPTQY